MDKLILIDGNSIANRAFYALPPMSGADGVPTQAIFGFVNTLVSVLVEYRPEYLAVAFDLPGPTFRHQIFDKYKATRKKMPDDLAVQLPLLKQVLGALGVAMVEQAGFEADDIIGTLSALDGVQKFVLTGDRDSLQLIDDATKVLLTRQGLRPVVMDSQSLYAQMGLSPSQIIDYKALAGDTSDNIPGVSGIGDKTALRLLEQFGTLDGIYLHLDQIGGKLGQKLRDGQQSAWLSRRLATIDRRVPLDCSLDNLRVSFPLPAAARDIFARLAFGALLKKDIWAIDDSQHSQPSPEPLLVDSLSDLQNLLRTRPELVALVIDDQSVRLAFADEEYLVRINGDLMTPVLAFDAVLECLSVWLTDPAITKILFDAKLVKKVLTTNGADVCAYHDLRLMQYLLDTTKGQFDLVQFLEHHAVDTGRPARALLQLYPRLLERLRALELESLYSDIELPLVQVLFDMEQRGFCVDTAVLAELGAEYRQELERLTQSIYSLSGQQFNINSPKQLGRVLFDDMGIRYPGKGPYSTAVEILEQLDDPSGIVPLVLNYRSISKLNSTYVEGLSRLAVDGVVHTEFRQMQTATGRLSSVEPNLQNIPIREAEGRRLRRAFVARPGHTLVSADYSQIELRIMAHMSSDPALIDAYNRGEDIHTATAAQVFDVHPASVTSEQRRTAKAVNFGIIYGISDFGLARDLHISVPTARAYIEKYFSRYPRVREYLDDAVKSARSTGCVRSIFGRLRTIPELSSAKHNVRSFGIRAAMNMPLQATAADIIKIAMLKVHHRLQGMNAHMILQVHDELIIEARDDCVEEVSRILVECMQQAATLSVPLTVELSVAKNWCKE